MLEEEEEEEQEQHFLTDPDQKGMPLWGTDMSMVCVSSL